MQFGRSSERLTRTVADDDAVIADHAADGYGNRPGAQVNVSAA